MGPKAADLFSRRWSTRLVAGMAVGHRGMRQDEFQQELRPGGHADLARPAGHWPACEPVRQPAALERPVGDDRDAALPGERQQAAFDLPVDDVVGQLDEIRRPALHDRFQFAVPPSVRGGDAGIAQPARRLHRLQRVEVPLPVPEVVHLQQVEAPDAPAPGGFGDLRRAVGGGGPDLVGREQARRPAQLRQRVADHRLGGAVHGRGIDHAAARLEEGGHDGAALGAQLWIVADIEGDPAAEPDRRHRLPGRRNTLREGLCRRIPEGRRSQRSARSGQHRPACHAHDSPFLFLFRTIRLRSGQAPSTSLRAGPFDTPRIETEATQGEESICVCKY